MSIFGIAKKGFGKALRKVKGKSKSNWVKDKAGTITGVKPGSGKVPWYIGASGKDLKKRADTVRTWSRVKTIDKIGAAEKKIKEGTKELKHLRQTGWTKRVGKGRKKKYFPKAD
tara:strand:- start:323 stop:664 length:342 start_codon:yes stop_codon:yes gene_type:complete